MSQTSTGRSRPTSTLPARDIAEMRVAEALSAEGCVLCRSRDAAERRFVDALIGEAVNDTAVRRRLDAAGGYCARHAALLPVRERDRRGGTLGTAILLGSVLRARLTALDEATRDGGRRLAGRVAGLRQPVACPLCADVAGAERSLLTILFGRMGDPAWAAALGRSELCLDDLLLFWDAAAQSGGRTVDVWRPIAALHGARLRAALATADGYIDHSSHDRQADLTDAERTAVDVLVRILAGRRADDPG